MPYVTSNSNSIAPRASTPAKGDKVNKATRTKTNPKKADGRLTARNRKRSMKPTQTGKKIDKNAPSFNPAAPSTSSLTKVRKVKETGIGQTVEPNPIESNPKVAVHLQEIPQETSEKKTNRKKKVRISSPSSTKPEAAGLEHIVIDTKIDEAPTSSATTEVTGQPEILKNNQQMTDQAKLISTRLIAALREVAKMKRVETTTKIDQASAAPSTPEATKSQQVKPDTRTKANPQKADGRLAARERKRPVKSTEVGEQVDLNTVISIALATIRTQETSMENQQQTTHLMAHPNVSSVRPTTPEAAQQQERCVSNIDVAHKPSDVMKESPTDQTYLYTVCFQDLPSLLELLDLIFHPGTHPIRYFRGTRYIGNFWAFSSNFLSAPQPVKLALSWPQAAYLRTVLRSLNDVVFTGNLVVAAGHPLISKAVWTSLALHEIHSFCRTADFRVHQKLMAMPISPYVTDGQGSLNKLSTSPEVQTPGAQEIAPASMTPIEALGSTSGDDRSQRDGKEPTSIAVIDSFTENTLSVDPVQPTDLAFEEVTPTPGDRQGQQEIQEPTSIAVIDSFTENTLSVDPAQPTNPAFEEGNPAPGDGRDPRENQEPTSIVVMDAFVENTLSVDPAQPANSAFEEGNPAPGDGQGQLKIQEPTSIVVMDAFTENTLSVDPAQPTNPAGEIEPLKLEARPEEMRTPHGVKRWWRTPISHLFGRAKRS